jgi:hypothetical protein
VKMENGKRKMGEGKNADTPENLYRFVVTAAGLGYGAPAHIRNCSKFCSLCQMFSSIFTTEVNAS